MKKGDQVEVTRTGYSLVTAEGRKHSIPRGLAGWIRAPFPVGDDEAVVFFELDVEVEGIATIPTRHLKPCPDRVPMLEKFFRFG